MMRLHLMMGVIGLLTIGAMAATASGQTVLFVDVDATGNNDGSTWENAFTDLQAALAAARQSGGTVGELWIAEGNYAPSSSGDRLASFELVDGLALLGGFAGGETSADERDPALHVVALTGDLAGDDGTGGGGGGSTCCSGKSTPGCDTPSCEALVCGVDPFCCNDRWDDTCAEATICLCGDLCTDRCDNSFHVITAADVGPQTILDGLTIDAGFATDDNLQEVHGGAMVLTDASPTVVNCRFTNHKADGSGGAILSVGGSPVFWQCEFIDNGSSDAGGAARIEGGDGAFIDCLFRNNAAFSGGGISEEGTNLLVLNCQFLLHDGEIGGAFGSVGGNALVANCIFNGNAATISGGAIRCAGGSTATFVNCTVSGNFSAAGGGLQTAASSPAIVNSIFWNNFGDGGNNELGQISWVVSQPSVNYTIVQGLTGALGGVGNLGDDPLFVDADGSDNVIGTMDDDYRLMPTSAAVDAASNSAVPPDVVDLDGDGDLTEPLPLDFAGGLRFLEGPFGDDAGEGDPPLVDMGALEQRDCNGNGITDSIEIGDGSAEDCNLNNVPDSCEIDAGSDPDCNENGVPDSCDILDGTSFDLNQDGIPDECQDCQPNGLPDFIDIMFNVSEDCNENDVPDECDVRDGTSEDCDGNEIPDECELVGDDCNDNDVPDLCDVNDGTSEDCNADMIPDECQEDFDGDGTIDPCDEDVDGDGVDNDLDVCDFTPPGTPVNDVGAPRGDANEDCDVDLNDFFFFEICLSISGPDTEPLFQDCVQLFDLEDDADVDMADFQIFQASFTGQIE